MSHDRHLSRRDLLKLAGSGFVLLTAGAGRTVASQSDLREAAKDHVARETGADRADLVVRREGRASWSTLGESYYHAKVQDAADGSVHGALLDAEGTAVDRETLNRRESAAFREAYGKCSPELDRQLEAADAGETVDVVVWLDGIDHDAVKEAVGVTGDADADVKAELAARHRERIGELTGGFADDVGARGDVEVLNADTGSPTVELRASPAAVRAVADRPGVDRVAPLDRDGYLTLEETTWTHRTYDDRNSTYNAAGYPIGHAEFDHPKSGAALNFAGKRWDKDASGHPTVTAEAAASNDDGLPGTAHEADVYSADRIIKSFDDRMEWFDDNGVAGISFSIGIGKRDRVLNEWDFRYGQYAYNSFLNLAVSAGNGDDNMNVGSPSIGFNQISVASTADENNGYWFDDDIAGYSCYENPYSRNADPDNDDWPHSKPEVSAVGSGVNTPSSSGGTAGTSLSAPAISALATLLVKFSDDFGTVDFSYYPELVKPIAMVSAKNDAASWEKEGAGTISAKHARQVVENGWFESDLYDESNDEQTYSVDVDDGETVRVAFMWLSNVTDADFSDNKDAQSDLDLDVSVDDPDGNYVTGSWEWDRGFEYLTFDASKSGTYTVTVNKYRWDAAESSRWVGLAWHRT